MKIENMTTDMVAGILADFMNGVMSGNENAYEQAVRRSKAEFELTAEREAAVRITLTHLEMMTQHCNEDFDLKGFVGLEVNVLFWTIAGDWDILNRRILAGVTDGN